MDTHANKPAYFIFTEHLLSILIEKIILRVNIYCLEDIKTLAD